MNRILQTTDVTDLLARQSQAIDEGDAEGWAATYTEDGSFHSPTYGDPVVGREAMVAFAKKVHAGFIAEGIQQRHWVNNTVIDQDAGTARSYALIVRTNSEGEASILRHITTLDHLVYGEDGELRMRSRTVTRD